MEFAVTLTQLIINILIIIFVSFLIILATISISLASNLKKLSKDISNIHFWISVLKKAPAGLFSGKKKTSKK